MRTLGTITVERLIEACSDNSEDSGIRIRATLEPLAGSGAAIKPAVYAGGKYQVDKRWWRSAAGHHVVDAVIIDNVPSQANRLEAALERRATELGLPRVVLDLAGAEPLPPHLPRSLSGFRFPHRQADAYLRDALLDGAKFPQTKIGQELFAATSDAPEALLRWFPQALLFGFWQSHLGKGASASQAKLARSWTSVIVGYNPATTATRQYGLKGDPLNLTLGKEGKVQHPTDESDWELLDGKPSGGRTAARLSEIGHGQVIVADGGEQPPGPAGVSFEAIEQDATVSFASLRRIQAGGADASAAARALLAALGLAAHVDAFCRAFALRSGCELRPVEVRWTWLGAQPEQDEAIDPPSVEQAVELFRATAAEAHRAGLPVGADWPDEPLVLQPNKELLKVIRSTYPVVE